MDGLIDLTGLGALTAAERFIVLHNDALASLKGAPVLADLGQVEFWENPLLTQAVFDDWIARTRPESLRFRAPIALPLDTDMPRGENATVVGARRCHLP